MKSAHLILFLCLVLFSCGKKEIKSPSDLFDEAILINYEIVPINYDLPTKGGKMLLFENYSRLLIHDWVSSDLIKINYQTFTFEHETKPDTGSDEFKTSNLNQKLSDSTFLLTTFYPNKAYEIGISDVTKLLTETLLGDA